MLRIVLSLFALGASGAVAGSTCIDTDGDGWGWNGTDTCLVQTTTCIDSDGDGWGWNGTASCVMAIATGCIDSDGDGWGWNGTETCTVGMPTTAIDSSVQPECIDTDGDSWGWDGTQSCVSGLDNTNSTESTDSTDFIQLTEFTIPVVQETPGIDSRVIEPQQTITTFWGAAEQANDEIFRIERNVMVLEGDTAIVAGAQVSSDNADGIVADYVFYQRVGDQWQQSLAVFQPRFTTGSNRPTFLFEDGAIDGDHAFVSNTRQEVVYAYQRLNGVWRETASITKPEEGDSFSFGESVSIDRNSAAIMDSDTIYLYQWNGTSWVYTDNIYAADNSSFNSVIISGNVLVAASVRQDSTAISVHSYLAGYWQLDQVINADHQSDYVRLLDFDGTRILHNETVYEKKEGLWRESFLLKGSTSTTDHKYDNSYVSIDGDVASISNSENTYVFRYQNNRWLEVGRIDANGSVVSGNNLLTFTTGRFVYSTVNFINLDDYSSLGACEVGGSSSIPCRPQSQTPMVYQKQQLPEITAVSGNKLFVKNTDFSAEASEFYGQENNVVDVYEYQNGVWHSNTRLVPDSGFTLNFGSTVAADGNQVLISATAEPYSIHGYNAEGDVHAFLSNGTSWQTVGTSSYLETGLDWGFNFAIDMSVNNDRAAYSSTHHLPSFPGRVVIQKFDGARWFREAVIDPPDDFLLSRAAIFGSSIVLGEDSILVVGTETYLYERYNTEWIETVRFDGRGPIAYIEHQVAVISGRYVFEYENGDWQYIQTLVPSDAALADEFAVSVAATTNAIVIGAPGNNDVGGNAGAAYVFEKIAGSWQEVATLLPKDAGPNNRFGSTVHLTDEHIIVNDDNGSAYYYERSTLFDRTACLDINGDGNGWNGLSACQLE